MTRHRKLVLLSIPLSLLLLLVVLLYSSWGLALGLRIAAVAIPGKNVVQHLVPFVPSKVHIDIRRIQSSQV